jgi:hypothetical protein
MIFSHHESGGDLSSSSSSSYICQGVGPLVDPWRFIHMAVTYKLGKRTWSK